MTEDDNQHIATCAAEFFMAELDFEDGRFTLAPADKEGVDPTEYLISIIKGLLDKKDKDHEGKTSNQ